MANAKKNGKTAKKMDSIYTENILSKSSELSFLPSLSSENDIQSKNNQTLVSDIPNICLRESKCGIYYISDIHLDHKLFKKFGPDGASDSEITKYIEEIVDGLLLDDEGNTLHFSIPEIILILGDTSTSFTINKIFYELLSRKCDRDIFVVLGNHELWEFSSVDQAVSAYRVFFDSLPNIHLLQNSLYISRDMAEIDEWFENSGTDLQDNEENISKEYKKSWMKKHIITEDTLQKMSPEQLARMCQDSKAIVFGAIGFSPLNKVMNVSNGIYRNTIKTAEQEQALANRAANIYRKLVAALPESYLVIASHMPLNDWTILPHQNKWVYFNGHTHKNERILDERGHIYSDNQVGYYGKRIKFNATITEDRFDYFAYYKDGVYDITENDYYKYHYGIAKKISGIDQRGGKNHRIIMLKNRGLYLFLFQNESGALCLLEGGKHRVIKNQDINYYYDNMVLMNQAITNSIKSSGIEDLLKSISTFIKHIGGNGHIHGNIVDIDYYNHIMVDLRSQIIIPYVAYSINDRYEYPNIQKLLHDERPDLYERLIGNGENNILPALKESKSLSQAIKHNTDTSIYKDSSMMLKIQDMLDYNVIRFWNDDIIDSIKGNKKLDSTKKEKKVPYSV